jgi:hypothetical protein
MCYICPARSRQPTIPFWYAAYIEAFISPGIVVSIMKSIQVSGQFTALDFHTGAVLEYHVDYDVVKNAEGKFFVPRSIEPIIYMEHAGGSWRSYFFSGQEWRATESTVVDTDDLPFEVLVTIIGKFFPTTTSRGNRVFYRTIKQIRVPMTIVDGSFFGTALVPGVEVENAPVMVRA